jgi:hypothetical protein
MPCIFCPDNQVEWLDTPPSGKGLCCCNIPKKIPFYGSTVVDWYYSEKHHAYVIPNKQFLFSAWTLVLLPMLQFPMRLFFCAHCA